MVTLPANTTAITMIMLFRYLQIERYNTVRQTATSDIHHQRMCNITKFSVKHRPCLKPLNKSSACRQEDTSYSHHHQTAYKFHNSIFPCTHHNCRKLVEPENNPQKEQYLSWWKEGQGRSHKTNWQNTDCFKHTTDTQTHKVLKDFKMWPNIQ